MTTLRKLLFLAVCLFIMPGVYAQEALPSIEELKTNRAEKEAEIAALQNEINSLNAQIKTYPGWKIGGAGILGLNLGQFNNWFPNANANATQNSFSAGITGFANLDREKDFWRTSIEWNANTSKTEITDRYDENGNPIEDDLVEAQNDLFNAKSLYGYRLSDKWAISGQGLYTTAFLDGKFNNPGNLVLGAGATWTPIPNLVAVIHPLGYNFVFSGSEYMYESSSGANITVDYSGTLLGKLGWKTQLLSFLSYEDPDATAPLSWWNWTNTVSFNLVKRLGVGINFGLRGNAQESLNFQTNVLQETLTPQEIDNTDVDIQSFYTIGLTYTLF